MNYVYDSLDRVSGIKYNTGSGSAFVTMYSYTNDSYGSAGIKIDTSSKPRKATVVAHVHSHPWHNDELIY